MGLLVVGAAEKKERKEKFEKKEREKLSSSPVRVGPALGAEELDPCDWSYRQATSNKQPASRQASSKLQAFLFTSIVGFRCSRFVFMQYEERARLGPQSTATRQETRNIDPFLSPDWIPGLQRIHRRRREKNKSTAHEQLFAALRIPSIPASQHSRLDRGD